jgi:hypothetical protein
MCKSKLTCFGLAMVVTLVGCAETDPTAPFEQHAPRADYVDTYGSYQLVIGPSWTFMHISNSHVIGPQGGRLTLGWHELIVPPGAVQQPTVFRMTAKLGLHIVVDLTAADRVSGIPVTTFPLPLELKLSYRFFPMNAAQRDRLLVLWLKDDSPTGELVPVPTIVNAQRRYISGSITHFSQYAMGMN